MSPFPSVASISCSITVKDDLIHALGIEVNVTDTFTLRFAGGSRVAVEKTSDDPKEFHDAQKWVQEHRRELIETPCQGFFAGGPTPGACAKAMVDGYAEFAANAMPTTAQ